MLKWNKYLKENSKLLLLLSLLIFFSFSITGCQSSSLKNDLENAQLKIEKLESKNIELNEELKETKEKYISYKKLNDAITEIELLNFIDDKDKIIDEIKNIDSVEDIESRLKELKELENKNKTNIINKTQNEINNLSNLSNEDKDLFNTELNSIENKEDASKIIEKAQGKNEELQAEASKEAQLKKEKTQSKENSSNQQSSNSTQSGEVKGSQVLTTPTGKRYHRRVCGNGSYSPESLASAKARGLTPCKKCY